MIDPSQPALSPLPRKPREKPAEQNNAAAFPDLLAAAGTSRRAPGSPPVLEPGPEIGRALIAPEQLERTAGREAPDQRPTARVFNEDGFFGSTGLAGSRADGADRRSSRPSSPTLATNDREADANETPPPSGPLTGVARAGAKACQPPRAKVVMPVSRGAKAAAAAAPAAPAEAPAEVAALEDTGEPIQTSPQRRLSPRPAAARSAVEVVARELEQGLHIAARVDVLDEAERLRMHDEITALLASHGLTARTIRIAARQIDRVPHQENFK